MSYFRLREPDITALIKNTPEFASDPKIVINHVSISYRWDMHKYIAPVENYYDELKIIGSWIDCNITGPWSYGLELGDFIFLQDEELMLFMLCWK